MTKRIFSLVTLSLLVFALTAMTAFAARTFEETQTRAVDPMLTRIQQYSFPDEYNVVPMGAAGIPKMALGWAAPSASPGVVLGDTWYDYQRNGSMRRMIARNDNTKKGTQQVHFVWMRLADSNFTARKCQYRVFNPGSGEFDCDGAVPGDNNAYMGYCVVDATNDDRGIPAGHNNPAPATGGVYQFQAWWDDAVGACDFYVTCRVPDTLQEGCQIGPDKEDGFIWPSMCWQEGTDTILHVFAQESNEGINPQAVAYFRSTDPEADPCSWDQENFYCVDTVNTLSQDCDCTDEGKVVIAWTANLPAPGGCDTCSTHDYWGFTQRNSDVYVQVSHNAGVSWDPRVNVTQYVEGVEGFRAYTDLSVLIDSRDSVHVVWNGMYWPADAETGGSVTDFRCRLFHWSGLNGSKGPDDINTIHDANWVMDSCAPGAWNLNASKMTISECDNKMYVLFVQYNDSNAVPAVVNDCAVEGSPGGYRGRANGELYLCVSDNWGDNWDKARNLTRSRTPACTLVAGDPRRGNCESDNWPSMVKFGTDHSGGSWPDNLVEIPPDSPYTGNYFLDIQYVNDNSAGGIVQDEGWWTQSDVKWFYIGCVEPVQEANLTVNPTVIGYPTWTKHGEQRNETVTLENIGNCDLQYTAIKFETTPPVGWLSVAPGAGNIVAGGSDLLTVGLNVGGVVNTPGTIVHLVGSLYVDWQGIGAQCPPNSDVREVVPIECWVTDTLYEPFWDTIHTACTKLIVANTGNFGKAGVGNVNMDYADAGDCWGDTANVYLYDGSPVIGYQKNASTDTVVNFSIFGTSYINENGFIPLGDHTPTTDMGEYEVFESGKFVTHDSLIAIEKIWYAPTPPAGADDTCSFVIQCMKIYLNDTLAVPPTDVRIGEAIDWDIPADSGSRNLSGFDWDLRLLWQQGSEEDGEGCQPNDRRWGGIDFLEVYKNGKLISDAPYGGYIKDNETQVYPEGGFHPDSLYLHMGNSGFTNSDTQNTDLHMVMTKIVLDVLLKTDTIVIYEEILTHWNGTYGDFIDEVRASRQWYEDHIKPESPGCCNSDGIRGDADDSGGAPNVGDVAHLVAHLFTQPPGPAPPCFEEGDADASGSINVGDVALLVAYLFTQPPGPPPAPCP